MAKFTEAWGIMHKTISPYNSKSNSKVESAVKTAKRMLKKAVKSGEDQYLALLNIRNTPTQGLSSSPVQRLMCRRTRTVVPIREELLSPEIPVVDAERQKMKGMQEKQASYYNRHTQVLPELKEDDSVRVKPVHLGESEWKKAKVVKRVDDRSYLIETSNGSLLRRNRYHLRHTNEPTLSREANLNVNEDTDGEDLCNEVYDDNVKCVDMDNGVPINVSNNISHKGKGKGKGMSFLVLTLHMVFARTSAGYPQPPTMVSPTVVTSGRQPHSRALTGTRTRDSRDASPKRYQLY